MPNLAGVALPVFGPSLPVEGEAPEGGVFASFLCVMRWWCVMGHDVLFGEMCLSGRMFGFRIETVMLSAHAPAFAGSFV